MRKFQLWTIAGMLAVLGMGCYTSHKIESTHEIKPIHITMDINIRIEKVNKSLDDFFGDIDQKREKMDVSKKEADKILKKADK